MLRAAANNDLCNWLWVIEIEKPGRVYEHALWPGQWLPTVEVGDEPEMTKLIAELLVAKFKPDNPAIWQWHIMLAYKPGMGPMWYRYGVDEIFCEFCGAGSPKACICTRLYMGGIEPWRLEVTAPTAKARGLLQQQPKLR